MSVTFGIDTTALRLGWVATDKPRVAAKRGNPGLEAGTALRYEQDEWLFGTEFGLGAATALRQNKKGLPL
jgi:hypothetical protein